MKTLRTALLGANFTSSYKKCSTTDCSSTIGV